PAVPPRDRPRSERGTMIARAISPILIVCPYDVRRPAAWVWLMGMDQMAMLWPNPSVARGKLATDARLNGSGQLVALADLAWDWDVDLVSDRCTMMERRGANPVGLFIITILSQAHDYPVHGHMHP